MNRKASWHLVGAVVAVAILLSLAGCGGAAAVPAATASPAPASQSVQAASTPGAGPAAGQAAAATAAAGPAAGGAAATSASQGSQDTGTRTITDLAGRKVTVPAQVDRIVPIHPIGAYMVYRLTPDKLVSVDRMFKQYYLNKDGPKFYSDADASRLAALPVTAVFFEGLDPEQLLALKPDVIVTIVQHPNLDEFASQIGVPVIAFNKDSMADYARSFRLIGSLVGNEAEGNQLADYCDATLKQVADATARVPPEQRLRVYYANASILTTPGPGSIMGSIMDLAGGNNVGKDLTDQYNEDIEVSLEQVIKWDPEVIFVGTASDKQKIMSDPGWQDITAVKNDRVFVRLSYADTDGIEALMGVVWAQVKLLHPGDPAFDAQFAQKMQEFYQLFFNHELTAAQITEVNP
jgi:iron complex transport system substrate-binding protein